MKYTVYLAGAITGLTYKGASDWRDAVAEQLDSDKIETLSPLRGKSYLLDAGVLHSGEYKQTMSTGKGINRRDNFDCTRADVLLVNLLGAQKVSIGTVMEIAWAYQVRTPIVAVMEDNNVHTHVMIEDCLTYKVKTLEEAVDIIKVLFNDFQKR
jgi:nucleoside 2-deoxyribosyltransferase